MTRPTLTEFRPRPKPFADQMVNLAVVMFVVALVARVAWAFASGELIVLGGGA